MVPHSCDNKAISAPSWGLAGLFRLSLAIRIWDGDQKNTYSGAKKFGLGPHFFGKVDKKRSGKGKQERYRAGVAKLMLGKFISYVLWFF